MNAATSSRRLLLTLLALCAQLALLAREHLDGGVRAQRRSDRAAQAGHAVRPAPLAGFLCGLAYGAILAALFAAGNPLVDDAFFGLLALALVVRLWHAEYLLGFVLAMSLVAGPVLPAMFGAVIALLSWVAHTAARALWRRLRPGLA